MAEPVLTQRDLNRATLARQLLLQRARLSVVRAVERVAGLQAQLAGAPYIGLWSRVEGFRRESLERALLAGKAARGVLMRGTVHVVSARDYGLFSAALDVAPPGWITPEAHRDAIRVTAALRAFSAEPRTRSEVLDWLEREHGVESGGMNGVWYALRLRARIAHAAESSLWSSPIHNQRFVAVEHDEVDGEAARAELVRRYLAAFGPATRAEIAGWSGMKVGDFAHLLDGLLVLRDDRGRQLVDLPRAQRPPGDTDAPVRLLPQVRQRPARPSARPAGGVPQAHRPQERRRPADLHRRRLRRRGLARRAGPRRHRAVRPAPPSRPARAGRRVRAPGIVARIA